MRNTEEHTILTSDPQNLNFIPQRGNVVCACLSVCTCELFMFVTNFKKMMAPVLNGSKLRGKKHTYFVDCGVKTHT